MGGFLGGLTDLLGGFNTLRRIDKEGFDFREQQAQQDFLRQRQRQEAQQGDEDRLLGQLTDVVSGQAGEPDVASIESQIPGMVDQGRKKWLAQIAMGRIPERRSSIEAAKAYTQYQRDLLRGDQQLAGISARGDEARELAELQAKLRAGQPMTEFERARIGVLQQAIAQRGPGGRRRGVIKVPGQREGAAGTVLYDQDTMQPIGFEPSAPTAQTRGRAEALGLAMNAYTTLMGTYDKIGGQPKDGLTARALGMKRLGAAAAGYAPEVSTYRNGIRGFVPLMARAIGHVGVLTELDVERTENLFPGVGDTDEEKLQKKAQIEAIMSGQSSLPFQLGQGGGKPIGYIDEGGNFSSMGDREPALGGRPSPLETTGAGPGEVRAFGGKKYRLKPGADRRLRSSWEVVP